MATCLTPRVETRDNYGYPAAALFLEAGDGANRVHIIFGSGDASDAPGVLYNNAPNGSIYIPLTAVAGNAKIFVKHGAKGLIDGTWRATAALT